MNLLLAILVSAAIDSTNIYLGDQTDLHLQASFAPGQMVQMPVIGETLVPGIEVVDRTIVDTIIASNGNIQLHQYLTLTSFQDSLFYISPLAFVSGQDTFYSSPLTLNVVQPFEIDTADIAITDIKPIANAPIYWWGIIRWILLALLLIGLGIGIWWLVRRIGQRTGLIDTPIDNTPLRPAEEVALEKLDLIKQEKIWQEGRVKEYQTQLTDVVREYISRRYEVKSTEKTSDETLREMKQILKENRPLYDKLNQMLTLADLVKFAKWNALPEENEISLKTAYTFVHETTPTPPIEEDKKED